MPGHLLRVAVLTDYRDTWAGVGSEGRREAEGFGDLQQQRARIGAHSVEFDYGCWSR